MNKHYRLIQVSDWKNIHIIEKNDNSQKILCDNPNFDIREAKSYNLKVFKTKKDLAVDLSKTDEFFDSSEIDLCDKCAGGFI